MKISPETAVAWGITITKDGVPVDFIEIDSELGMFSHTIEGELTNSTLKDFTVDGLFRYLLIMGK